MLLFISPTPLQNAIISSENGFLLTSGSMPYWDPRGDSLGQAKRPNAAMSFPNHAELKEGSVDTYTQSQIMGTHKVSPISLGS